MIVEELSIDQMEEGDHVLIWDEFDSAPYALAHVLDYYDNDDAAGGMYLVEWDGSTQPTECVIVECAHRRFFRMPEELALAGVMVATCATRVLDGSAVGWHHPAWHAWCARQIERATAHRQVT